jgi:hypothetical protein
MRNYCTDNCFGHPPRQAPAGLTRQQGDLRAPPPTTASRYRPWPAAARSRSFTYALRGPLAITLLAWALSIACTRRPSEQGGREQALSGERGAAPAPFDFDRPLEALRMTAGEAARRGGAFAFEAHVAWSVSKPGSAPLHASEVHRVRQLPGGAFEVSAAIDPGLGPGSVTGKELVFVNGTTYARALPAPFRRRPIDRGWEARRARDDSFQLAGDVARLFGKALSLEPAGEAAVAGRTARRYVLSLSGADLPAAAAAPPGLPGGKYDPDTRRHVDFLEGRVPTAIQGEMLLDAETGVPLEVTMKSTFTERSDPGLHAELTLDARMTALGAAAGSVTPPPGALPDDRKPKGVASALEAAGLRARAQGKPGEDHGADERDAGDER